ncbi:DUF2510 domain-containing protein [Microbacterium sp. 2FI]|uniref:DUF2510 domain-containing protein n=1 Tax=Microbacterium sp. 2FI TaxID=2502193 RepID=UPI0020160BB2|nr:DUF2510 domain-containing protein [Microbacterium sp. 2FI]
MTAPEAGWYDDGTGRQRWWDGSRWSGQYIDLRERDVELHSDASAPLTSGAAPGWYDDGRGRQRWWDGAGWTNAAKFSGEEQVLAGVVVDGRWLHFGVASEPVAGARASVATGAELLKRGRLGSAATARALLAPSGPITPRLLKRSVDPASTYLVVEVAGQVWLAFVGTAQDAVATRFATWINTVAEYYRYR